MDKIDKLLDAIEHPDRYADAEIEAMLQDPQVKEAFDILDKTGSALRPITPPDVEAEWRAFEERRRAAAAPPRSPRFRLMDFFSRNIAASIAIAIVSFAAVAAVVGMSVGHFSGPKPDAPTAEIAARVGVPTTAPDTVATTVESIAAAQETVVFDNETLETIIPEIASHYGYKVVFGREEAKGLRLYFRWNQALPMNDVVESLNNFEQIHLTVEGMTIKVD